MKSIIVTGANSGIGFACATYLAKIAPKLQLILACRNQETGNEAVEKIKKETGHQQVICMLLDLASLQSVRTFKEDFSKLPDPEIVALVNNAGGLFMGDTQYTIDGFELTFGTNHLGGFYLTLLLLPFMEAGSSITFVSSGVHDPDNKTRVEPPEYTDGEKLAYPEKTTESKMKVAQRRYSTSKLCNVLTAYKLQEKLSGHDIRVNAFDPGQVLGTGFLRTMPAPMRFIAKHIMPFLEKDNNSVETSGSRLAQLACSDELSDLKGAYYSEGEVKKSSIDSYNKDFQSDLWKSSIELTKITAQDTVDHLLGN